MNQKTLIILFQLWVIASNLGAHTIEQLWQVKQPRWDEYLDFEKIETALANEKIIDIKKIKDYFSDSKKIDADNDVYIVLLENNLKAIFKPNEDWPAEIAAYQANKFMNYRLVPPTVMRIINDQKGSLQFFVESDIDLLESDDICEKCFSNLYPKVVSDMKLFYFIFGQWDMHPGNQIIQINNNKYYLALIDNAGLINKQQIRYGDFAFICRSYDNNRNDDFTIDFPFNSFSVLNNPTIEEIQEAFGNFLSESVITQMWDRYTHIVYCIWRNALWIKFYNGHNFLKPNYTKNYYQATIDAYKKLDRTALEKIWAIGLAQDENLIKQLINLTLERKEQLLKSVSGNILRIE